MEELTLDSISIPFSREDALRMVTRNPWYLTFEENTKGMIAPGRFADLVVLPEDIMTMPARAHRADAGHDDDGRRQGGVSRRRLPQDHRRVGEAAATLRPSVSRAVCSPRVGLSSIQGPRFARLSHLLDLPHPHLQEPEPEEQRGEVEHWNCDHQKRHIGVSGEHALGEEPALGQEGGEAD